MTAQFPSGSQLDGYRESVRRAEAWLVSILNPDGTINPVSKGPLTYYKVPRGLAIVGRLTEAKNLLNWTEREIFTAEGDFKAERKGFHHYHYTYSSAWFVWAAQVLGRFDISFRGMNYLRKFRNPKTNGYCSEAVYSEHTHNEQDILTISFNSLIGLSMGMVKEAEEAAVLLARIFEGQPDRDRMIWLRVNADGEVITRVPEYCEERRYYVLEVKAPAQYYYYLGSSMVFFAKLYAATGNERYLNYADMVYDICMNCHEDVFLTDGTGKVGLGSAFIYDLTGEKKYAEAAVRSCDFLVKDQHPDGCWVRGGQPTASSTAEFIVWLWEIVSILSRVK